MVLLSKGGFYPMSHIVAKSAYKSLEERLNRFPLGAAPTETLYKILALLFSEKEAALVAQLPIKPFSIKQAAKIWKVSHNEARIVLDELANRCILIDLETNGTKVFVLPPPMAGFIEFSMMRVRDDLDQHLLGQLYYEYMNVEEDFVKGLFDRTQTQLGRAFVNEPVLTSEQSVHVLDYERATHVIESASHIGISMCYCRHKMEHVGKACDAPMDICMTFNGVAASLIKRDYARKVDISECKELLHQAYEHNLVQFGENVRNKVSFICNCCGCCCEALLAQKRFGHLHPIETTNFLPKCNEEQCISCGKCERVCPVDMITMEVKNGKKVPAVNESLCIGCGVCVRNCPNKSLLLQEREKRILTPANSVHKAVLMAIEKGTLQELIFDNKALVSHRAMAAILSAILKLSPIKKAMASEQMKSIYLDKLLSKNSEPNKND